MKLEQVYQHLLDLSEKLGIKVYEKNLNIAGIKVRSGLCKVEGILQIIIDKKKSISQKVAILKTYLKKMPLDDIYVVPKIRDLLKK